MNFPICPDAERLPLIEMKQVPAHCNVLWNSQEEALSAPRGNIRLVYAPDCGHIFNMDFDPALMEYTQEYENSLHFSAKFQEFATGLAKGLVERHGLYNKDIVEIGAGKGDFLLMMAEMGNNRGWGFDPSYVPDEAYSAENVTFIQDFYSEKYTSYSADMITCRHVLEHIEDPDLFIQNVKKAVNGRMDTIVFFEMPNALFTIRQLGIWDIIYEHCSYFTPYSLAYLFRKQGFEVLKVDEVFGGQFVTIEAKLAESGVEQVDETAVLAQLTQDAQAFSANYQQKVDRWAGIMNSIKANNQKAVIWGTGSKGVTFLNVLDPDRLISYAVDINPRKQGKFVGGSGQEIVSPEKLRAYQPDVVIIMNANYEEEIGNTLKELGVNAEILLA
ncbi:MAG: class I SAM-dependent methyltransferase [Chloroflexota bacterium]